MNWRRGLFRLWLVFAVLWIAIAVATTWKQFVYFQPTAPGKPDFLDTTEICAQSTTAEACANLRSPIPGEWRFRGEAAR